MSAAAAAAAGGSPDFYGELENRDRTLRIEQILLTKVLSPNELLSKCLKADLVSFRGSIQSQVDVPDVNDDIKIKKVILSSSFGNHAVFFCKVNPLLPGNVDRVSVMLEGEVLAENTGVTTRRYDQAIGVAQPVFPHLIDRLKELFVDSNNRLTNPNPKQVGDAEWEENWSEFADAIMEELNRRGINAGREAFKDRLIALFDRIRGAGPDALPLRVKYCEMAKDLWRVDPIQHFGATIQKGVLATINIGNDSDRYKIHHGKSVQDTNPILKASYNLLGVVNVVIGERVYTIHLSLNRVAVDALLPKDRECQSGSYWVSDVIKWIHENKSLFFSIITNLLFNSISVINIVGVNPQYVQDHKKYLLKKMREMSGVEAEAKAEATAEAKAKAEEMPNLYHAAFLLGCKCFALDKTDDNPTVISFYKADESSHYARYPILTKPISDMTIGITDASPGTPNGVCSASIEPIFVIRPNNIHSKITNVQFNINEQRVTNSNGENVVSYPLFHVPSYSDERLSEALSLQVGDFFDSGQFTHNPSDTDSMQIRAGVAHDATILEKYHAAVKRGKDEEDKKRRKIETDAKKAEEERLKKAEEERLKKATEAIEVTPLIQKIQQQIDIDTSPQKQVDSLAVSHKLVQSISEVGSDLITKSLNYICGIFRDFLSPLASLERTGIATPSTVHIVDQDTAVGLSLVLMCALNYGQNLEYKDSGIKALTQIERERTDLTSKANIEKERVDDNDNEKRIHELDQLISQETQNIKIYDDELKKDRIVVADLLFPQHHHALYVPMWGHGIKRKRTLRRGSVKKNTRRERRGSIQSRRWYNRNRDRDLLKKKNTQRHCSRKTKTIKVARCR